LNGIVEAVFVPLRACAPCTSNLRGKIYFSEVYF